MGDITCSKSIQGGIKKKGAKRSPEPHKHGLRTTQYQQIRNSLSCTIGPFTAVTRGTATSFTRCVATRGGRFPVLVIATIRVNDAVSFEIDCPSGRAGSLVPG